MGNTWEESAGTNRHCLNDATSVVGLRALVREHPSDWRGRLRQGVPGRVGIHRGLSLCAVLEAGAWPQLLPMPGGSAEGLRQPRASARRLVGRLRDTSILHIDEEMVRAVQAQMKSEGVSGAQLSRDLSLLRRVVRSYHLLLGERGLVRAKTPGNKRRGPGRERKVPPNWATVTMLEACESSSVKARIALAGGGGIREAESLRIWLPDVDARGSRVWVRAFEKGRELEGRGRWVDLPTWVMRWVVLRMGEVWQHRPDALLFCKEGQPRVPARSCAKAVKAACSKPGYPLPDEYTLGDLQRSWQAVARANGLCHELVRRTLVVGREDQSPEFISTAYPAARKMNAAWKKARLAPGFIDWGSVRVPRRVKGLMDWEPEPLEGEGWR